MIDLLLLINDIFLLLFDLSLKLRDNVIQLIHLDYVLIINNVNVKRGYLQKLLKFELIIAEIPELDHLIELTQEEKQT